MGCWSITELTPAFNLPMHIGEERLCVSKECLPNEMTQANTRALTSCVVPRLLAYCVPHELDFQKNALKMSSVHGLSVHTVIASVKLANSCTFFVISLETAKKQTGKITKFHALIPKDPRQGTDVPKSKLSKS